MPKDSKKRATAPEMLSMIDLITESRKDPKLMAGLRASRPKIRDFSSTWRDASNPLMSVGEDATPLEKLAQKLYGAQSSKNYLQGQFVGSKDATDAASFLAKQGKFMANPLNAKTGALKNTATLLGQNVMAHPGAYLGTAANLGGNVAGLLDNNKFLGQGVGTAAGVALPLIFGIKNPLAVANIAAGAGNVGALFDALRAKKEQQRQAAQQYSQYGG